MDQPGRWQSGRLGGGRCRGGGRKTGRRLRARLRRGQSRALGAKSRRPHRGAGGAAWATRGRSELGGATGLGKCRADAGPGVRMHPLGRSEGPKTPATPCQRCLPPPELWQPGKEGSWRETGDGRGRGGADGCHHPLSTGESAQEKQPGRPKGCQRESEGRTGCPAGRNGRVTRGGGTGGLICLTEHMGPKSRPSQGRGQEGPKTRDTEVSVSHPYATFNGRSGRSYTAETGLVATGCGTPRQPCFTSLLSHADLPGGTRSPGHTPLIKNCICI